MLQALYAILAFFPRVLGMLTRIPALFTWFTGFGWLSKLMSFGFFTVGIPLLFQWGFFAIAQQFANPLLASLDLQPATVELTGTAAWLAIQLQLPLALSILMGFALQALILRLYAAGGMFSKIVR